ncbi:MAG: hypothetical protein J2P28_17265, partial [Actinobacteria bacterium]|nr:hypothetical protein [Actinomycetota bacterium]
MTDRERQGWYEDPSGIHERRFFTAGRPTRLVRDGGREFYEEQIQRDAPRGRQPDFAANSRSGPSAGYGTGTSEADDDSVPYTGQLDAEEIRNYQTQSAQSAPYTGQLDADAVRAYRAERGRYAAQSTGGRQSATGRQSTSGGQSASAGQSASGRPEAQSQQPGQYRREPPRSVELRLSHGHGYDRADSGPRPGSTWPGSPLPGGPRRSGKKGRAALAAGAVAVFVVGAIVVLVGLRGHGGNGNLSLTPEAFVNKAATQTMAQKTAHVTLSGSIQAAGKTAAVRGTGELDLANKAVSLNLSASVPGGGSLQEHEIVTGGTVYLEIVAAGQNLFKTSLGKPWLAVPVGPALQSGSTSTADSDPASSLAILQQKGAKVTRLGSRSIGGQSCDGYKVTPSLQAMVANLKQEWTKAGLTPTQMNTAVRQLQAMKPPTITVWFNPQRQLACQMDVAIQTGGTTAAS